ncbi:MAG: hypothetical protein JWO94_2580 [Verrucomicrobiaceae bacterium]|nr:hypothetical protein [Verrucomicrobiaceae bacterium]
MSSALFDTRRSPKQQAAAPPPVPDDPAPNEEYHTAVLVVDDRRDKRQAVEAVLADLGYPVMLAESGLEALRHLLREDFSVILLDLNMPDMDGIELAKIIRSRRRTAKTPIIFYTADASSAQSRMTEAYNLGAVDLLLAPVPAQVLRSKVAVFADIHRRLMEVRRVAGERERLLRAEAARAEAERASAAKDHFLAMLSHELRTPLSPVLNTIEMLLQVPDQPAELRQDLEMIRRNVALEARLIDDLLDLTRVSRGKVELRLESVDVHESLQSVLQICGPEINEKEVNAQVFAAAVNCLVQGDAARLKQIFWNLIRNALKYTEVGGKIVVTTADAPEGGMLVEVKDFGSGIHPELLPGIFDAFFQGSASAGGLGLGLAITRSLMELHGGTVQARSPGVGLGATFSLHFPAASPRAPTGIPDPLQPAAPPQAERLPGCVLLVEDHVDSRFTLERLLRRRGGYVVETAGDVRTALEITRRQRFDVIISDIGLPDGTGYDFITQIPLGKRPPAIALTGFGMEEDIARSARSGFARHLTKPIDFAQLDSAIQSLLVPSSDK